MNSIAFIFNLIAVLFQTISAKIVPFSACPSETCYTKLSDIFIKCAPHFFLGCQPLPTECKDGSGYVCTKPSPTNVEVKVEPGKPIVLEKVKLYTSYSFKVDLSALPLDTDFYLLSDATGSMGGAIRDVQNKFKNIVDFFQKNSKNPMFGIGFYRDEKEFGMVDGFSNSQALTSDLTKVQSAISRLKAQGGGDGDEANLVALYKVASDPSIGWRKNSRRIVVYFGDWPGHEPTCFRGATITRTQVINALKKAKITVVAVSFPPPGLDASPTKLRGCTGPSRSAKGQGTAITTATGGGSIVLSSNQAELVSRITAAIKALPRTFDLDDSDCVGKLKSTTTPTLPVTIAGGSTKVIDQNIQVLFGVCSAGKSFSCDLRYTEAGADLGKVNVKLLEVEGCPV